MIVSIFKWFDTREIDELAQAIVAELVERVPPSTLDADGKAAADRLRNTHEAVFARARSSLSCRPCESFPRFRQTYCERAPAHSAG